MLQKNPFADITIKFTSFLLFLLCVAVSANSTQITTHATLDVYKKYLSTLDATSVTTITLATNKYKELFSGNDTLRNDTAYSFFENYYYKVCVTINQDNIFDTLRYITDDPDLDSPSKYLPRLAIPYAKLRANGFRLELQSNEDAQFLFIAPDRTFISRNFYPFVSFAMRQYQDQLAKANSAKPKETSSLHEGLAEEIVWWVQFADTYPKFIMIGKARDNYLILMSLLLHGMDDKNAKIRSSFRDEARNLIQKWGNTKPAIVIKAYSDALTANDRKTIKEYQKKYNAAPRGTILSDK